MFHPFLELRARQINVVIVVKRRFRCQSFQFVYLSPFWTFELVLADSRCVREHVCTHIARHLASSDHSVPEEGRRWWLKRWSEQNTASCEIMKTNWNPIYFQLDEHFHEFLDFDLNILSCFSFYTYVLFLTVCIYLCERLVCVSHVNRVIITFSFLVIDLLIYNV